MFISELTKRLWIPSKETAGDVDQDLTGDKAYEYNHVTVTGLEPNTTYYYTVEKNGEQTEPVEYTTKGTDTVKMIYVGDPQVGASKGQTQDGAELVPDDRVQQTQQPEMTDFPGIVP